jgi:hypothetical protein
MDRDTADILESLRFIKDHMLTRGEGLTKTDLDHGLGDLKLEIDDKIGQLASKTDLARLERPITQELDEIREQLGNVTGFRREIDHALERITKIEKQLRDFKHHDLRG